MLMKRIYLMPAAIFIGAVVMSAATAIRPVERAFFRTGHGNSEMKVTESPAHKSLRTVLRNESAEGLWRPGKVVMYEAGASEGEWEKSGVYTTTYNSRGLFTKEILENVGAEEGSDEAWVVTVREYDESGHYTLETVRTGTTLDGVANSSRVERAYDPRIPGLVVENFRYSWVSDTWSVMAGVSYKRDVARNDAGNVTEVLYKTLYQGEYTPVQRVEITYGDDGKASSMTEYQLQYDESYNEYWQEGFSLRDCQWYKTDGQLYDLDYVFEGNNLLKSCNQYHEGEFVGTMAVTFVEGTEDFESVVTMEDGTTAAQKWTDLPYGGYENVISYSEPAEEGAEPYSEKEIIREEYDMFGNMTHSSDVYYMGDEAEVIVWSQAESELNVDGVPVSLIMRDFIPDMADEDYDEEEEYSLRKTSLRADAASHAEPPVPGVWEDTGKFEFSDLVYLVSSIGEVTAVPATDAEPEYFTIDGRRVSAPPSGLYIRRIGSRAEKVVIR